MNKTSEFDRWYWGYRYGSKITCIKAVEQSDLPEEEKKQLIKYHTGNLGITR